MAAPKRVPATVGDHVRWTRTRNEFRTTKNFPAFSVKRSDQPGALAASLFGVIASACEWRERARSDDTLFSHMINEVLDNRG